MASSPRGSVTREEVNALRLLIEAQNHRFVEASKLEDVASRLAEKIDERTALRDKTTEVELAPLRQKIDEIGRPNWTLVTSIASAVAVLVTAIWVVIGLKIENVQAPMQLGMEQVKNLTASNADRLRSLESVVPANTQAATEIANLKTNYGLLSERQATMRSQIIKHTADLTEIETQFCGADIVRNLMHAADLRQFSLIWQKVFDAKLPTDNVYYPMICNRGGTQPTPQ